MGLFNQGMALSAEKKEAQEKDLFALKEQNFVKISETIWSNGVNGDLQEKLFGSMRALVGWTDEKYYRVCKQGPLLLRG